MREATTSGEGGVMAPSDDPIAVVRRVIAPYDQGTMRTRGPWTSPAIPCTCRG
jgi:hypothetical protein